MREIIKTAIENKQNLIVEGCYISFNYQNDFTKEYFDSIKYICLIFSESYIRNNYEIIMRNAKAIENRLEDDYDIELMIADNRRSLNDCKENECSYILIDKEYNFDENIETLFVQ
ncbi:hypothetical protein [Kineothrix sedimenti]|uniref:AAA domain-containing protein n=1 Tax=Kineothrix sedimenti TaxID=3123317 RepID=A0ABZ3EWH6_9FIRM